MRTTLLGCLLTTCLLGQVWSKHLLVETEPEVKSQEQGEIEDVIESKNKEGYDTESRLLGLLDEEDAEILKKMPKEEKKTVLKQVGEVFANEDAGSDYQFVGRNAGTKRPRPTRVPGAGSALGDFWGG